MCGRFDTSRLTWRQIHDGLSIYATVKSPPLNLEMNDDVRPTTMQAVARLDGDGWLVEKIRWGLVPFWREGKPVKDTEKGRDDGFKLATFNARSESVVKASTFREAFKNRRCIVPASAWYEWTGEKGAKVKHRFSRVDDNVIWFAGLWDHVTTPDQGEFSSFTILTASSAGILKEYHDRAPVILDESDWATWLNPDADPAGLYEAVRPERFVVG